MKQSYLSIHSLTKHYYRPGSDQFFGLDGVEINVNKGEMLGIIGTNGAGKSTLFNVLTGMVPADSGTFILDGQDITSWDSAARSRDISRVFQDPSLGTAPRMTVFENLMLAQKRGQRRGFRFSLNSDAKDRMREEVASYHLGLEHSLDMPIDNLSGGQRQIISLLMATIVRPKLLLLDEHTSALDPRMAKQIMMTTHRLIEENELTTIMITHRMQEALKYCDRIAVMHRGRINQVIDSKALQDYRPEDLHALLEALVVQE